MYITICAGEGVGKEKIRLPYSKIAEYGITLEGLPEDVILKHPTSYGRATMRKILANKDLYHMTGKGIVMFISLLYKSFYHSKITM